MFSVRHRKVSESEDSDDATLIQPSDWNAEHEIVGELPAGMGLSAGFVAYFAGFTAPDGWLVADGSVLLRSEYPALYAAIGDTFGGAGASKFKLPDLRLEFLRGASLGREQESGNYEGEAQQVGARQRSQNKWHDHGGVTGGGSVDVLAGGGDPVSSSGEAGRYVEVRDHTHGIAPDGAGEARPRNVALLPCIKV